MILTSKQIQAILDGAPEGATHIDIEGDYWVMQETQAQFWCDKFDWSYAEPQEPLHSLSDLREILTLRQEVECLKAQQSEVAAQAIEGAAKDLSSLITAPPGKYSVTVLKLKEIANQLREQGDE